MARGQPKGSLDRRCRHSAFRFGKRGGPLGLLPGPAAVRGPKDGGPKMTGSRRHQQGPAVTRIEEEVVDLVPEEHGARGLPLPSRRIAAEDEGALFRADEQPDATGTLGNRLSLPALRRTPGC